MWCRKLIMALALCAAVASAVLAQQDNWNELNRKALKLYQDGKYTEATKIYEESLEVAEKVFGPNHPNVATSMSNLAGLYGAQGKYSEAEPLFKRALAIREKALGPDHLDVAISLNDLAELYRSQGRYTEAEPLYKRSLPIYVKALEADHPVVAETVRKLEEIQKLMGKRREASECQECPQRIEPQRPNR